MFRFTLIFFALLLYIQDARAQNFESVPCYNGEWAVSKMFLDSLHNKIILSSKFNNSTCNTSYRSLVEYNGAGFSNMDIGLQTHDTVFAYKAEGECAATFNNATIVGGNFQSAGTLGLQQIYSSGMALWKNNKWDTLPKRAFTFRENFSQDVYGFYNEGGRLWICGYIDTLGGIPGKNLYYYENGNYTAVNIPVTYNDFVGKIINYKNELYITGNFYNFPYDSMNEIVRYKNGIWKNVGPGVKAPLGGIFDMVVYKDTLYVGGEFAKMHGNAGNHLMKWDGTQFTDAGFGNFHDWGGVRQLIVYKNRLYAFGRFTYAANKKAFGAAYYENGTWVTNSDSLNNVILNAVLYKGNIYVSGGFSSVNGDTTIKYFAKLKCPDFNGCPSSDTTNYTLNVFPSPFYNELNITIDDQFLNNSEIEVIDNLGKQILLKSITVPSFKINTNSWSNGVYLIRFRNKSKSITKKVVKL